MAAIADMSKDPEMYVYALQHPETLTLAASILLHSFRPHTSSISPSSVSKWFANARTHSISGRMTGALTLYSGTFMRYALAVTPANYLLFGCHAINFTSQLVQGYRYLNYWNFGGREASLQDQAKAGANIASDKVKEGLEKAKEVVGK
jgi:hypothetical protein